MTKYKVCKILESGTTSGISYSIYQHAYSVLLLFSVLLSTLSYSASQKLFVFLLLLGLALCYPTLRDYGRCTLILYKRQCNLRAHNITYLLLQLVKIRRYLSLIEQSTVSYNLLSNGDLLYYLANHFIILIDTSTTSKQDQYYTKIGSLLKTDFHYYPCRTLEDDRCL